MSTIDTPARRVTAAVNYIGDMRVRPRYYANDHSRDVLDLDPRSVPIEDARHRPAPSLAHEGFELRSHASAVRDFRDPVELQKAHKHR